MSPHPLIPLHARRMENARLKVSLVDKEKELGEAVEGLQVLGRSKPLPCARSG